jgi:chromosomal replication initiator protein
LSRKDFYNRFGGKKIVISTSSRRGKAAKITILVKRFGSGLVVQVQGGRPEVYDGMMETPLSGQLIARPDNPPDQPALSRFVLGDEHRLVPVAVQSVLEPSAVGYRLVVLYGPSGSGKTHLASAIASQWKAQFPREPVVMTTAMDFARELADAIETKTIDDFGGRYRRASLLVLEDLGHLTGKEAAQQELIHVLDSLMDRAARIVLTAPMAPGLLPAMLPALQSRLVSGLMVALAVPQQATRLRLLRHLAAERSLRLSEEVLEVLANDLAGTAPELSSVILQMELSAQTQRAAIDVAWVRRFLATRQSTREPSLRNIALRTARHFALRLADLRGPTRRRAVVVARDVAMYLARTLTRSSLDDIGRYFGGRDHTTVAHGCRQTEERLQNEPAIRLAVEELQLRL